MLDMVKRKKYAGIRKVLFEQKILPSTSAVFYPLQTKRTGRNVRSPQVRQSWVCESESPISWNPQDEYAGYGDEEETYE